MMVFHNSRIYDLTNASIGITRNPGAQKISVYVQQSLDRTHTLETFDDFDDAEKFVAAIWAELVRRGHADTRTF